MQPPTPSSPQKNMNTSQNRLSTPNFNDKKSAKNKNVEKVRQNGRPINKRSSTVKYVLLAYFNQI